MWEVREGRRVLRRPRGPLTYHLCFCTCSLSSEELAAFQKERAAFLAAQKEADLAAQAEAAKK